MAITLRVAYSMGCEPITNEGPGEKLQNGIILGTQIIVLQEPAAEHADILDADGVEVLRSGGSVQ